MNNKSIKSIFAQRYRYYMNLHGKTRQDIVRDLGFKYTTICDWETGTTIPRMDKLEMLAQYFGCKNSDLLEEPKQEKPKNTETPTVGEDDGLSERERQLIQFVRRLSDKQVDGLLALLKSQQPQEK